MDGKELRAQTSMSFQEHNVVKGRQISLADHHKEQFLRSITSLNDALATPSFNRPIGWCAQVQASAYPLSLCFGRHVDDTERVGGIYDELLRRTPRLAPEIQRLRLEHVAIGQSITTLLRIVDALIITGGAITERDIERARTQGNDVLARLASHRQQGNELTCEGEVRPV